MPKWLVVLLFVAGAALSWGVYVPLVHGAAMKLQSNLRAFLFVGVAYFLVAVLVPMLLIFVLKYDPTAKAAPNFNGVPILWGIMAGVAGALGALLRHLRGNECRGQRSDLCCAARVCRSTDYQYVCYDLLFPPGKNVPGLEVLPRARVRRRGGRDGDAV